MSDGNIGRGHLGSGKIKLPVNLQCMSIDSCRCEKRVVYAQDSSASVEPASITIHGALEGPPLQGGRYSPTNDAGMHLS